MASRKAKLAVDRMTDEQLHDRLRWNLRTTERDLASGAVSKYTAVYVSECVLIERELRLRGTQLCWACGSGYGSVST